VIITYYSPYCNCCALSSQLQDARLWICFQIAPTLCQNAALTALDLGIVLLEIVGCTPLHKVLTAAGWLHVLYTHMEALGDDAVANLHVYVGFCECASVYVCVSVCVCVRARMCMRACACI